MAGLVDWDEAKAWVDSLVFGGFDDWRLPTTTQHDDPTCSIDLRGTETGDVNETRRGCLGGEMEQLTATAGSYDWFTNTLGGTAGELFVNLYRKRYWSGTPYRDGTDPCIYYPGYDVPCINVGESGDRTGFYWQWGFGNFNGINGPAFKTTMSRTTDRSAWAVRDGGFDFSLAANTWTMFSLPFTPVLPATVTSTFGDDLLIGQYGNRWVVYEWNAAANSYTKLSTFSTLSQNKSYWILSLDAANLDVEGSDTAVVDSYGNNECAVPQGCYEIPLVPPADGETEKYNLVGHVFPATVPWKDVRIRTVAGDGTTEVYTPSQAAPPNDNIMDKTFWLYKGGAYESHDDSTIGMEGELVAFDGFWVRTLPGASAVTTTLLLPKVPVTP